MQNFIVFLLCVNHTIIQKKLLQIKKSFLKHESTLHLAIDRNCPHWKLFLEQADKVDQIIKKYLEKDLPIDIFPQKKMHSLGYRLTLLDTQLPSIS